MLLVFTGSSCSGKTTLARAVAARVDGLVVHDFDEFGVPSGADMAWRQRTGETWVRRAHAIQQAGRDTLLTGQSPLGEILATPSVTLLDGVAVALIDVDDAERADRLAERNPGLPDEQVAAFLGWARWHRGHAADPAYHPEVIVDGAWTQMRWDRWRDWTATDPRWQTDIIDTSGRTVADCAQAAVSWVIAARAADPAELTG